MKSYVILLWIVLACNLTWALLYEGEDDASPRCPPNEVFWNCPVDCMDCETRGWCARNCNNSRCDCMPRFFRQRPGGPCLPVGLCPIGECGPNEVFRECGPLCESCFVFPCAYVQCYHKCVCKQGYRRDIVGSCVPDDECPKRRCRRNEEMADSGPADEFCLYDPRKPRNDSIVNVRKCYCEPGYRRDPRGHCIPEESCGMISCIEGEVYNECVPRCSTTCRNYGDPDCQEDGQCYPGCFCPTGYVMNDHHVCVLPEDCFPESRDAFPEGGTQVTEVPAAMQTTEAYAEETSDAGPGTTLRVGTSAGKEVTTQKLEESIASTPTQDDTTKEEEEEANAEVEEETVEVTTSTPTEAPTTQTPKRKPQKPATRTPKRRKPKVESHSEDLENED